MRRERYRSWAVACACACPGGSRRGKRGRRPPPPPSPPARTPVPLLDTQSRARSHASRNCPFARDVQLSPQCPLTVFPSDNPRCQLVEHRPLDPQASGCGVLPSQPLGQPCQHRRSLADQTILWVVLVKQAPEGRDEGNVVVDPFAPIPACKNPCSASVSSRTAFFVFF